MSKIKRAALCSATIASFLILSATASETHAVTCTCSCNISRGDLQCQKKIPVSGGSAKDAANACTKATGGLGQISDCH